jgi:hypothetical protein
MQPQNPIDNNVPRNEEFFKVRKELYIGQLKFGIILGLIFVLILVTLVFALPNLDKNIYLPIFLTYTISGATLWEKKYKMDILNKYDPKYKNVKNWS